MGVKKTRRGWAIDYYRNGKRVQEYIGQSKTLAVQALAKVKTELANDRFFPDRPKGGNQKVLDILIRYWSKHLQYRKSGPKYGYFYESAKKAFGHFTLETLGKDELEQWMRATVGKQKQFGSTIEKPATLKPATVNRIFQFLAAAINYGIKTGTIRGIKNPCSLVRKLPENNVRDITIDHVEFERLLRVLPAHSKPVVSFAYYTGCRLSEVLCLKKADVDFFKNVVHIRDTKNGESRYVPIAQELKDVLLTSVSEYPESPFVFNNAVGSPLKRIMKGFRSACIKAKLDNLRFHDLRHSALTNWHNQGHSHLLIMQASGHKTLSCFQRYLSFKNADLQKLVSGDDRDNFETGQTVKIAKAM